jgi:hypothetical protein
VNGVAALETFKESIEVLDGERVDVELIRDVTGSKVRLELVDQGVDFLINIMVVASGLLGSLLSSLLLALALLGSTVGCTGASSGGSSSSSRSGSGSSAASDSTGSTGIGNASEGISLGIAGDARPRGVDEGKGEALESTSAASDGELAASALCELPADAGVFTSIASRVGGEGCKFPVEGLSSLPIRKGKGRSRLELRGDGADCRKGNERRDDGFNINHDE